MKKLLTILLSGVLLVGCSASSEASYLTSLPEGDSTALTSEGVTISKDDIYHYLLDSLGSATVLEEALAYIAQIEVTDQDSIDQAIEGMIEDYESYMGVTIDEYATSQGYPDGDTYIEEVITPSALNELLTTKYVTDNYEDLISEYNVKYLKVVTYETESEALDAIDTISSVEDFDTLVEEDDGSDYGFCTVESSLDENLLAKFDDFSADGLYSSAIETTTGEYAIVYVYNTDLTEEEENVINSLAYTSSVISKSEVHYLTSYEFSVYEGIIYDEIDSYGSDYLG